LKVREIMGSVSHYSIFICLLHLSEKLEDLHQILFESCKYALRIFTCSFMSMKAVHAVRNGVLRKLGTSTACVMMVNVDHAEFGLQAHCLREKCHQLVEGFFSVGHLGIIHKDNAMGIFLNGGPAFLILEVTTHIPELHIDSSEVSNAWGWVSFEVNDSTI
jgi:hypothetical protein